jgi:hypothetical protein
LRVPIILKIEFDAVPQRAEHPTRFPYRRHIANLRAQGRQRRDILAHRHPRDHRILPDADLFSFVMTESLTFGLYGVAALALVHALKASRVIAILLAGGLFGLLALTRASFVVVAPVAVALIAINDLWLARVGWRPLFKHALVFSLAWMAVIGPWLARNAISTDEWRLSEEYGSAALIERFAYDDMTAREFVLSFPYCLPTLGQPLIEKLFGTEAMERFIFSKPGSFFHIGRTHREQLVEQHQKLDPIIGGVIRDEMHARWWRYLLVSLPLGWCGLLVGGRLGLALAPLFVWGCVTAVRRREPLFLPYATPPLVMLVLHAVLANHYTRYNLILIGPFAAATAWFVVEKTAPRLRRLVNLLPFRVLSARRRASERKRA